ncbi:hypothetical protein HNQ99_002998 [Rhizorhapis suberifaciens]|uniref:Uncharacterized protein n=1 Tax=Rhizorhapis suberifaciens TaxID=13656 RepID=A0A840HWF8_9SPHN|nr:hypothetical protein [Rhizorhapis suberifaciens]
MDVANAEKGKCGFRSRLPALRVSATAAFIDEKCVQQARTRLFERDGKSLLPRKHRDAKRRVQRLG